MDREPDPKKLKVGENGESVQYPVELRHSDPRNAEWYEESLHNPEKFWDDLARQRIRWMKDYSKVMDVDMTSGSIKWFQDGVLNVTGNLRERQKIIKWRTILFNR